MVSRTHTACLTGLSACQITVEVDGTQGIPNLIIIGLPTKAVEEAKERITSALINCGIRIKSKRTVVNLAPADVRKSSSGVELAIAIAILHMYGEISRPNSKTIFFGELSLDGQVKAIKGALPLVLSAKKAGFDSVILPAENQDQVKLVEGIKIYLINHLREYLNWDKNGNHLELLQPINKIKKMHSQSEHDFKYIIGQTEIIRACEIAAAGGHNLLLVGPPGAGKSLIARTLKTILPPLTKQEILEVTALHSLVSDQGLITSRPFRSPHHTISHVGLVGGGNSLLPGEISLSHKGILFLDEFPEFSHNVRESIRQPLEDKTINIKRVQGSVTYPADFTLIAAANPCPCGFWGSSYQSCYCSPSVREKYQGKLSGPILDRIDMQVWVKKVPTTKLHQKNNRDHITSEKILEKVVKAKQIQNERYLNLPISNNSNIPSSKINNFCQLNSTSQQFFAKAIEKLNLSARSYFKLLKVARTIADLESVPEIKIEHLAEALQYRNYNRDHSQS